MLPLHPKPNTQVSSSRKPSQLPVSHFRESLPNAQFHLISAKSCQSVLSPFLRPGNQGFKRSSGLLEVKVWVSGRAGIQSQVLSSTCPLPLCPKPSPLSSHSSLCSCIFEFITCPRNHRFICIAPCLDVRKT